MKSRLAPRCDRRRSVWKSRQGQRRENLSRRPRRLGFEPLEDRRLLSVGAGLERLFAVPTDSTASIVELSPNTGAEINRFVAPAAPSGGPDGLAFDGTSLFYLNGSGLLPRI
jgi:hypothetical protein